MSWQQIPISGDDPSTISSAARALSQGAQDISTKHAALGNAAVTAGAEWQGSAATTFHGVHAAASQAVGGAASAHASASKALGNYHDAVVEAHQSSHRALRTIQSSVSTYSTQASAAAGRIADEIEQALSAHPHKAKAAFPGASLVVAQLNGWSMPCIEPQLVTTEDPVAVSAGEVLASMGGMKVSSLLDGVESLSSLAPNLPGEIARAHQLESEFANDVSAAYQIAVEGYQRLDSAAGDAAQAILEAESELGADFREFAEIAYEKFGEAKDWALSTIFEGMALRDTTSATVAFQSALQMLKSGSFDKFVALDKEGFESVAKVAAKYGEDSAEALRAQLGFESKLMSELGGEIPKAFSGLGKIAPEGLAKAYGILGRAGVGLAGVADLMTIFTSHEEGYSGAAWTTDRVMSGLNLAGLGAAEFGASAATLLGADAAVSWVPVVGEVVVGGTALYLAGDFIYHHREQIAHAAEWVGTHTAHLAVDAAHGAETVLNDVGQGELALGKTAVTGAEDAAKGIASGAVKTAGAVASTAANVADTAANAAGDVASGAVSTAKSVGHDLNPLNW